MTEPLARLASALADRYRIERELGAGGMATVYLAEDLKHDRKVAIKVLKPELAAVLGAERFVVEIKTTAAMSHPHILPLFDSGTAEGFLFYVMPFIEGETLRDKLNRETQLGIDEAVRIATEVADALDYAHRHGVIHRDIKPENILLHDGRPMVADFGIALAVSAAAGGRMTETGLSLGTPHYMSPEQATAEKEITGRSDQYSLASVLYEMLAGDPPFTAKAAQAVIMKIITEPAPSVTTRRKNVPTNVDAALGKALEKLPADRFETAKAFADALGNPAFHLAGAPTGVSRSSQSLLRRAGGPFLLGAATVAAVAALGYVLLRGPAVTPLPTVLAELDLRGRAIIAARISPDGSTILMSPYQRGAAVIRRVDDSTFTPLKMDDISGFLDDVSFSPDGREIAWVASGRLLRAPLAGGAVTEIARIDSMPAEASIAPLGMTWGSKGVIVTSSGGALWKVPASGGTPERVPVPKSAGNLYVPRFLPDGKRVLATQYPGDEPSLRLAQGEFVIVSLDGSVKAVGAKGAYGVVISAGYLVAIEGTNIRSYRFDASRGRVVGEPRLLTGDADIAFVGSRVVDVSQNGIVAWLSEPPPSSEIMVTDRRGSGSVLPLERGGNRSPRFSPDGRRLAFERGDNALTSDVWLWDFASARETRLTADSAYGSPTWAPGGNSLVFQGGSRLQANQGVRNIKAWRLRVGGGKPEELLATSTGVANPALTLDGRSVVFAAGGRPRDIVRAALDSPTVVIPLASGPSNEEQYAVSPDGKWLAFTSDRIRTTNVYLRRLDRDDETWQQVSPDGGDFPRWARGGELLFIRGDSVMSVTVSDGNPPRVTAPRALFARPPGPVRPWDVSDDGQRFAFSRPLYNNAQLRLRLLLHAFDGKGPQGGGRE